jgi:hypothetical protein
MVAATRVRAIAVVPRRRHIKAKVATAASAGLLTLSGVAAAGALPSVAQQHVSTALARVGIELPRGDGKHGRSPSSAHDGTGAAGTTTNHGDCVSQVAGSGGAAVSSVARSDCGKPPSAGGAPTDATQAVVPPGQAKADDKTQPTHPTQPNAGGSRGDGNATGHEGTSQGNGHGQGATSSPPGPANGSAQHPNGSPPSSSPQAQQGATQKGHAR